MNRTSTRTPPGFFFRLPSSQTLRGIAGDFFGAFADSAILLPLLMLLARMPGFSLPVLLGSTGAAYLLAGWFFRLPMSVQPLKSIAIASITIGAGAFEIKAAGFLLGIFFLALFLFRKKDLPIPEPVVRSVQTGLGIMLLIQAKTALPADLVLARPSILLFAIILLLHYSFRVSSIGFFAVFLFLNSLTKDHLPPGTLIVDFAPPSSDDPKRSAFLIASLLLPQLALTSANSIKGARLAMEHYFKDRCERVTIPRLMLFVGLGNVVSALLSGLPFCHGAGGITAHVKGGATTSRMNWIIGGILLGLAFVVHFSNLAVRVDSFALPAILACVGLFHLELARPLFRSWTGRLLLLSSIGITLFTSDLLWVMGISFGIHFLSTRFKKGAIHA